MPFTYEILVDDRIARCELTGPSRPEETIAMLRQLAAEPAMGAGWGVLLDVRRRVGAPTPAEVAEVIVQLQGLADRLSGRIAFLTQTQLQFGMSRMTEIQAEMKGLALRGFQSEGEALAWLGSGDPPAGAGG